MISGGQSVTKGSSVAIVAGANLLGQGGTVSMRSGVSRQNSGRILLASGIEQSIGSSGNVDVVSGNGFAGSGNVKLIQGTTLESTPGGVTIMSNSEVLLKTGNALLGSGELTITTSSGMNSAEGPLKVR